MNKNCILLLAFLPIFFLCCSKPEQVETKKDPKEFVEHGNKRIDNYHWLSNPKDSAVIEHLKAENAYTEAMLKHTEGLQKKIYDELVARIEQKYESLPFMKNGYWYCIRYGEGQQYPVQYRKKGNLDAREESMLDIPLMAKGHQIFLISGLSVSQNNTWLAYGVDTSGDRRRTLHFLDLSTQKPSPQTLANTSGDYAWASDNKTIFYVLNDPTVRAYKVMRHRLGTDPKSDQEVYAESDSTYSVSLSTSRDDKFIFINSGYTENRETRYITAGNPEKPAVVIQRRQKDLAYSVIDHEGELFFLRTNDGAKNFKLVSAPIRSPGITNWKDVIPHRPDALLESARVLKNYIVAQQKIHGLPQILVIDRRTRGSYYVDFAEQAYVATIYTATDAYDLDSIRYVYSSLTTPRTEFKYTLDTQQKTFLKQEKIGGGFVDSLYETKRIWAAESDTAKVPISLVYRKSLFRKDGSNPMLLYAYGSYGYSTDPQFNRSVISLLDRGFVYGIAHIRGGQELGRQWYEDGKFMKKKNTFIDYVTCAQFLVTEKYTAADRFFANGASAGGMLMGAVTNMRPDLFRGVLAEVPWMDVITESFNTDLPLVTLEYDEWGNPAVKEQYEYMLTWSPLDNVRDADYPAILATGGLNDTQVPYSSPAKWVAKVRDHNTGKNPVLFKVNMGAGHGGESGRFEREKLTALKYTFMLDLVGRNK